MYVIERKQRVQEGNSIPSPIAEEGCKLHTRTTLQTLSLNNLDMIFMIPFHGGNSLMTTSGFQ